MDLISSRSRAVAVALMLAGAVGIAGCGSSNAGPTDAGGSTPDASSLTEDAGQSDAGQGDAGQGDATSPTEAGLSDANEIDAGPGAVDCGAVPPVGTQIVASTDPLVLQGAGLTSDGYAFYEDSNTETLYAVLAADGGAPTSLGTVTSQAGTFHLNGGTAALFLPTATNPITSIAPLSVWTAASGPVAISTTAFAYDAFNYTYDVTQDGSYVAYFVVGADDSTVTLTVFTVEGKTQTSLVSDIDLTNQNCSPMVQFVGDTLVAYYCLAAGSDAGTVGALTIATFAGPSFATQVTVGSFPAPTTNTPLQAPDSVSPDGTLLLVAAPSGLALYPIAGGAPTMIDSTGTGGGFTPGGDVVYSTTQSAAGGAVKLYSIADGGAPITLDTSGVNYLLTLSPDGNWLQGGLDGTSVEATDVLLISAATPGSVTTVWAQPTGEALGFSTDSKYELFATNLPMNFGVSTFDVQASPVSGGTPTKIITSAGGLAFTTGSKILSNANPNDTTGGADIEAIDLSSPNAASTLVSQADPNFFYAAGSNQVLYSWHCAANSTAGVWSVAAP